MNGLLSGMVNEELGSLYVSNVIIQAFVSALSALKPNYPYPPDPDVYMGNYSMDSQLGNLTITVATNSGQLTMDGLLGLLYLAYQEPYQFQVS